MDGKWEEKCGGCSKMKKEIEPWWEITKGAAIAASTAAGVVVLIVIVVSFC